MVRVGAGTDAGTRLRAKPTVRVRRKGFSFRALFRNSSQMDNRGCLSREAEDINEIIFYRAERFVSVITIVIKVGTYVSAGMCHESDRL